jgi:hypothetical protein
MQLSLFNSTLPVVRSPRACSCGSTTAVLKSSRAVHAGELCCTDCGKHLMWASHSWAAEIRGGFVTGVSSYLPGCRP